ncbi:uncharacterized protein BDV17DRAFT_86351 [Aspergillus undulatus]|uniref:uncharacterized protein n=1 Tax=Aspergillus undulatus TaxID=1810928 RepID=UPI003CCD96FD
MQLLASLLLTPLLAAVVSADCSGPISYTTCEDRIVHWFNPETGEVCDPLDCGGGRAPVKYDVPGCAAYTGTEIYTSTRSILSCWTPSTVSATTTASETPSAEETKTETETTPTSAATTTSITPSTTPAPTSAPAASSSTGPANQTETADEPIHTGAAGLQMAGGAGSLVAAVGAMIVIVNLI